MCPGIGAQLSSAEPQLLWHGVRAGIVRDNCMNNTKTVGEQLRSHGVSSQVRQQAGEFEQPAALLLG